MGSKRSCFSQIFTRALNHTDGVDAGRPCVSMEPPSSFTALSKSSPFRTCILSSDPFLRQHLRRPAWFLSTWFNAWHNACNTVITGIDAFCDAKGVACVQSDTNRCFLLCGEAPTQPFTSVIRRQGRRHCVYPGSLGCLCAMFVITAQASSLPVSILLVVCLCGGTWPILLSAGERNFASGSSVLLLSRPFCSAFRHVLTIQYSFF